MYITFSFKSAGLISETRLASSIYFCGIELTFGPTLLRRIVHVREQNENARQTPSYRIMSSVENNVEQHVPFSFSLISPPSFLRSLCISRLRQHTPTVKSEKETAENKRNRRKKREAARRGGKGWLVLYKTRSAITIATSVMRVQIHLRAV